MTQMSARKRLSEHGSEVSTIEVCFATVIQNDGKDSASVNMVEHRQRERSSC